MLSLGARRSFFTSSMTNAGQKTTVLDVEDFPLELGGSLKSPSIVWEQWGSPSKPTVLVLPSFSVGSHAHSSIDAPTVGWWESFIGRGLGIDTEKFFVVCPSNLGSPYGSTSPVNGPVRGRDFPQITPADVARATHQMCQQEGLTQVHGVVGGSFGGNVVLSLLSLFPKFADRGIAISCTGKTSPLAVGLRHCQRQAILNDPDYWKGLYPTKGMALARAQAMLLYKSWESYNNKFSWDMSPGISADAYTSTYPIESYLDYQGQKFAEKVKFDPDSYLLLSKCADLTDLQWRGKETFGTAARVGETYLDAVLRIEARLSVIGITTDIIIPSSEQSEIYNILKAARRPVSFVESSSPYGHDAFLTDPAYFIPHMRKFLDHQV